jgi:hypothetical protein
LWSWLGLIFGVAFGLLFTTGGIFVILSAAHVLSTGDYSTERTNSESTQNPYFGLVMGAIFGGIGPFAASLLAWDLGRKSWLIQPAERLLLFRAVWPFWQVSLVYRFDDIKDIRVGSSKGEDGRCSFYPELVGRFQFTQPGVSHPDQRANIPETVETIRNAILNAGWRPTPK